MPIWTAEASLYRAPRRYATPLPVGLGPWEPCLFDSDCTGLLPRVCCGGICCGLFESCCNGVCSDPQTDPLRCGGCDRGPCPADNPRCCFGFCVKPDESNCTSCL